MQMRQETTGKAKYKFEQKYIDKGIKFLASEDFVETTTDPTDDLASKYSKLLDEYERDRQYIAKLQNSLPKQDAVTK
jgi:hypothetical protein